MLSPISLTHTITYPHPHPSHANSGLPFIFQLQNRAGFSSVYLH